MAAPAEVQVAEVEAQVVVAQVVEVEVQVLQMVVAVVEAERVAKKIRAFSLSMMMVTGPSSVSL